jgi:hypothetical protein
MLQETIRRVEVMVLSKRKQIQNEQIQKHQSIYVKLGPSTSEEVITPIPI